MADEDQNDQSAEESLADAVGKPGTAAGSNGDGAGPDGNDGSDDSGTGSEDLAAERDKWKKLSRQNEKNLRDAQNKIKEFEDKNLSESQRLEKERDTFKDTATKNASELQRYNVAIETAPEHATLAQLRKVAKRLRGDSPDDLESDAKELWEDFAPAPSTKSAPTAGKPKERLKGGSADPDDEPDEMDPAKIVANIPRAR